MQVGPAMSPYVSNTTYGGYADIKIGDSKIEFPLGSLLKVIPAPLK